MLSKELLSIDINASANKEQIVSVVGDLINRNDYKLTEINDTKPWGAYFSFENSEADRFIGEFFVGFSPDEVRSSNADVQLSPKILIVAPSQRLSWQYHNRRAERWTFLTGGLYKRSLDDNEGELITANAGDVVCFAANERHRLIGSDSSYTIVAEIWQHTDTNQPSNEDDIIRLQDDYKR